MKLIICIIALLGCNSIIFNQQQIGSLNGTWQYNTPELSDALIDNYVFLNGNFEFNVSSYNKLSILKKVKGTFRIDKNKIYFKPTSIIVLKGNKIMRYPTTSTNNSWTFVENGLEERKLDTVDEQEASFKIYEDSNKKKCIDIDDDVFYKIK